MGEAQENGDSDIKPIAGQDVEAAAEEESPADVFEHLARIRSGISDGVITPW